MSRKRTPGAPTPHVVVGSRTVIGLIACRPGTSPVGRTRKNVSVAYAGADDFMPKPFRIDELLARIRLRLQPDRAAASTVLRHGDLALDLRTRRVTVAGRMVELTAREFALAETLFRHPGQVLSREQLLNLIWGYDYDPGSNIVDVYIRHLRRKLGRHHVATVRGAGYRLE